MIVTKKVISLPNNSKVQHALLHVALDGQRFYATQEQVGTGWASVETNVDRGVIEMSAIELVGKAKRREKWERRVPVTITGNPDDEITISRDFGNKTWSVAFCGVKTAD